ncbi:MAG: hypothetical protein C7B47_08795 [Sulfobacillus thermosulfidooxidans]|uniref:HTH cro/C1-type domain-containing protein n=1 Tax=Sulfobacillus thermosulfidooxidans TaxID=28034 RepID=A0A2T2WY42_SULTH|nr:MAG: hypothetical protein C7B47_08795 [Sulfobacillus thermosulfidooxidans]
MLSEPKPGYTVKLLRLHYGFSQEQLATQLGVSRMTVSHAESVGETSWPSSTELIHNLLTVCPPFVTLTPLQTNALERYLVILLHPNACQRNPLAPPVQTWIQLTRTPLSISDQETLLTTLGVRHQELLEDKDGTIRPGFVTAAAWFVLALADLIPLPSASDWGSRCAAFREYMTAHPVTASDLPVPSHVRRKPWSHGRMPPASHAVAETASALTPDVVVHLARLWDQLSPSNRALWVTIGERLVNDETPQDARAQKILQLLAK